MSRTHLPTLLLSLLTLTACGGGSDAGNNAPAVPRENLAGNSTTTTVSNLIVDQGDLWQIRIDESSSSAQIRVIDTAYGVVDQTLSLSRPTTTGNLKTFNYTGPDGAAGQLLVDSSGETTLSGSVDRQSTAALQTTATGSNKRATSAAELAGVYNVVDTRFRFLTQDNFQNYDQDSAANVPDATRRIGTLQYGQARLTRQSGSNSLTEFTCQGTRVADPSASESTDCAPLEEPALNNIFVPEKTSDGVFSLSTTKDGVIDYIRTGFTKTGQTHAQFSVSRYVSGPQALTGDLKGMTPACRQNMQNNCEVDIGRLIYVRAQTLTASAFQNRSFTCRYAGRSIGQLRFNSQADIVTSTIPDISGSFQFIMNRAPIGDFTNYDERFGGFFGWFNTNEFPGFAVLEQAAQNSTTRLLLLPAGETLYLQIPIDTVRQSNYAVESQALAVCSRQ